MAIAKSIPSNSALGDRDSAKKKRNLVKPTEAQLRYAQFHHKRRAQAVKYRIDKLHQTPLQVQVVTIGKIKRESIGTPVESDDGYSSVDTKDTSDVELKAIRLKRPKISAGRRAFLKDSKRAYRRRRKDIEKHGYRGYFEDDDEEEDNDYGNEARPGEDTEGEFALESDEDTDNEHNKLLEGQDQANLNQVFATLPKQQSRPKRRKKKTKKRGKANSSVDDSYQRFQAACHAMMRNIQTSQTKAALPKLHASKRWKRSKAHVEAAEAQKQTDFYRYKTSGFVASRKTSEKNAALLLSYKYFQQNQSTFKMDTRATWLTHLPAKQAKRSQGNHYYFQNMADLPHLIQQATSFDENQDNVSDNESVATLAMRKPGPQKFHRLVAYVQQRLIEKEKQREQTNQQQRQFSQDQQQFPQQENQQQLLQGDSIPNKIGQDRTDFLSPSSFKTTPSRIQQMADSIEGKGGTPKMKLHNATPFSELSNYSSSMASQNRKKRRRSKYVPRMRLRDFVVEGSNDENENEDVPTPLPRKKLLERFLPEGGEKDDHPNNSVEEEAEFSPSNPPRMKLRDSVLEEQQSDGKINETEFSASSPPRMKLKGATPPRMKLRDSVLGKQEQSDGKNHKTKFSSSTPPRMKLRDSVLEEQEQSDGNINRTEFSSSTPPRMKLRDSVLGEEEPQSAGINNETQFSSSTPPRMRLRDSVLGDEEPQSGGNHNNSQGRMSTSRTREMAQGFEAADKGDEIQDDSKFQQIRKSLEPQSNTTPRMKLRGDFDRIDEKKVADHGDGGSSPMAISRSSVGSIAKKYQSPPTEEQLEDFNRPSREVMDEFSKHIDPRIYEQFEQMGIDPQQSQQQQMERQRYSTGSSSYGNSQGSKGAPAGGNRRQSGASNVTEFFARIRGEQQQRQNELQQGGNKSSSNYPLDTTVAHPKSPSEHSDAVSDLSKGSNISELWNRGRNSISTMTSNLNTIAENKGKGFLSPEVIGKGLLSPDVIGKATTGLFNKFRGVPEHSEVEEESTPTSIAAHHRNYFQPTQEAAASGQNTHHQKQPLQGEEPEQAAPHPLVKTFSIDSHDALRQYRQTRASMSPEASENMSEASSFHALPNQIREVVQNSGGKVSPSAAAAAAAAAATSRSKEDVSLPPRFVSPNRSSVVSQSTMSPSELSADQYKRAHGRFMENSQLLGGEFEHETIIDTDDQSLVSNDANGMDPNVLASLMMSPDILQKRLKQAIGSVEQQKWDQVLFLINANPWLAEMKELTTNQFLLHKLAFFGTGHNPAPMSLAEHLIEKFPAAVHKFDQDGNVPLHLASAAGNVGMIKMLGDKFSSGASIRNEDGMLPLHFAIASFADFESSDQSSISRPLETIKTVLKLFPQAIAIADNDGNLPLHVAAECLEGGVGVDVAYLLMDEAERQLEDPFGARFRNKIKMEELLDADEEKSQGDMSSTLNRNASFMENDEDLQCTMVLNDMDETPLLAAIRSNQGWEMIEALVSGPGGRKAALKEDSDKNNALHLLVGEFQDATAAMSILKIVPETAFHRNSEGILPIEMACMVMMPEEVILAIALVDLPINIDDRDGIKVFKDRGDSWVFLTCDCDDHMSHVVEEILSICSFQQLQELCFWKEEGAEQTVLDRATPKCREAMNRALRFLGRFEFLGDGPLFSDMQTGFKAFDALDFGGNEEGKPVLLECYQNEFDFENRVYTMFDIFLESRFVEEVNVYVEHLDEENASGETADESKQQQQQRCVAIERPRLTLKEVVQGMVKNGGYDSSGDTEKRMKYSAKICSVLKLIGKSLRHLHEAGVVHGNLCMDTCGKFEDSSWKLMERLGVQAIGKPFDPARFLQSFPPESLEALSAENDPQEESGNTVFDSDRPLVSFAKDFVAEVSVDVWAFGKICYESLVGKALIDFDTKNSDTPSDDVVALLQTCEWNVSNMETVFADLLQAGIGESGADMITACLFPSPKDRPVDMDEILNNPFWEEIRKHRSPRKGRNRRSGESVSTSVSLFTDVDRYEV